jgi:hypothetical protein
VNFQIFIGKEQNEQRKNTLSNMKDGSEMSRHIQTLSDKRVDFLLYPSCFWCTSYFNFGELSITRCPFCYDNRMEQLPIPT